MRPVARSVFCPLALGALAVVAPATAEESETVTAVYFGAEDSAENAGTVAAILTLLDPPVTPGAPPVHLDRHFEPGTIHILGAGASRCTGGPVDPGAYEALFVDLESATRDLEDTGIIHKSILAAQSCLSAPVTSELLTRVHFLEGVNQFELDQDAARESFRLLHAIDPSYPWDDSYPPNAQMCFADAKLQVLGQHKVSIRLFVPSQAAVWLDGASQDPAGDDPEVFPGHHLLQFQEAAGAPLRSVAIQVEPEREAAVFDPQVLSTTDQAGQDAITTAVLRHLASIVDAGVPDYVVALSPEITIWRWNGETDALEKVATPAHAAAHLPGRKLTPRPVAVTVRGKPSPVVPILIGAGAGMLVAGAILSGTATEEFNDVWDGYDAGTASDEDFAQREERSAPLVNRNNAGIGLLAGGGAALVVSVPLGILTVRGLEQAVMTATIQVHAQPGSGANPRAALSGATVTLRFRPPR